MSDDIQAIPTEYGGVRFKSRLEARFAEWLTEEQKVTWEYEPKGFESHYPNGYLPDFFVPEICTYVEIKPRAKFSELNMFCKHIMNSSHHWICVDSLDRERWTIISQNIACGVVWLPNDNYFIISTNTVGKRRLAIHARSLLLAPQERFRLSMLEKTVYGDEALSTYFRMKDEEEAKTASDVHIEEETTDPDDPLKARWDNIVQEVRNRRPLIVSWLEPATPLSFQNGTLKLGYPKTHALAVDSLSRPNNQKLMEEVASQILGGTWRIEFEFI